MNTKPKAKGASALPLNKILSGDCIDVTLRNKLVNEQAYTMVGTEKKKVYYSDGNPVFADLSKSNALLVGAGETIELVARHLIEAGVSRIVIANRTLDKANIRTLERSCRLRG